jgi:putative transposase
LDRRRRLLTDHIDALREATRLTQTRHPFSIDAMVVLPDHIYAGTAQRASLVAPDSL